MPVKSSECLRATDWAANLPLERIYPDNVIFVSLSIVQSQPTDYHDRDLQQTYQMY